MPFMLYGLASIASLISLVCFILVLIKMFQDNKTGLAVACIVLGFCFGIGEIMALVFAWQNAGRWRLSQNFLMIFTVALVAFYVLYVAAYAVSPRLVLVPLQ